MSRDRRFGGHLAVVTGAGQGIGRAVALKIARQGGDVVLADRAEGPALAVREECLALGAKAHVVLADLETCTGARDLIREAERIGDGRIDILVNNVGGTIWFQPFWEYQPEQIEAEIRRSLWPTLWCCHAVLPGMIRRRAGVIVNVGSVATRGIYRVPYAASKGGVEAITTTLALETAQFGLRVNCVAPGGVDVGVRPTPRKQDAPTEQEKQWTQEVVDQTLRETPMKRYGTPDELADAICFLASDESSYMTGQTLFVAGGAIG
ncbi:MAG: 1,6-dihydroxycyclohexa-2,4-diene-1-carboxylate dehydrogenase [Panacagrimonas sp.]